MTTQNSHASNIITVLGKPNGRQAVTGTSDRIVRSCCCDPSGRGQGMSEERSIFFVDSVGNQLCELCGHWFDKRHGMARVSHGRKHVREGRAVAKKVPSRFGPNRPHSVRYFLPREGKV